MRNYSIDYENLPSVKEDKNAYHREYMKQYRKSKPDYVERQKENYKKYLEEHKDELKEKYEEKYRYQKKEYYQKNKDRIKERSNKRYHELLRKAEGGYDNNPVQLVISVS